MNERGATHPRFPALDAMRGGAAILVMLYHLGAVAGLPQVAPFGFLAVDLFFMMSGFVIARAYEPRLRGDLSFRAFVGIRIARIYPMLIAGVLVGTCIAAARGEPAPVGSAALRSLLLVPDFGTTQLFPLNPVLWSLFYELLANLLHAALARHLTTRRIVIAAVIAGLLFAAVIDQNLGAGLGWGASTFVGGFARVAWGYLLGMLLARVHVPVARPVAILLMAGGLVLLAAPAVGFTGARVMLTVFCALPLAVLSGVQRGHGRWMGTASILGALSFPLYAIHQPLLWGATTVVRSPWQWAIVALVLTAAAAIVGRSFDGPAQIRLRQLLTGTRLPLRAPATPPPPRSSRW